MKPISLSIAGLHSFREPQVIDFEKLCETGVFGIFGPTGSGKSTILDAITLALYGKVERAANNTRGILNHAEEKLTVKFLFELGSSKGRRRYRVERSFKRSSGDSVNISNCRLVELTEGNEKVISDKTTEITAAIERLLGLNVDDFTRAVVLPQGKFSEFLSLKGAERRRMLQRLFNLQQYGESLNQRLNQYLNSTSQKLQSIEGEQRGLGEASEAAVKAAKALLDTINKQEELLKISLNKTEKEFNEKKQVWELQNELNKLKEEEKKHQGKKKEIEIKEKKLEKALRAEEIRPYLDEVTEAENSLEKAQKELQALTEKFQTECLKEQKAREEYEKCNEDKQKQEPLLIELKSRLEQALKMEQEAEQLLEQLKKQQVEYEKIKNFLNSLNQQIKICLTQKEELAEKLAKHQKELEKNSVTPEYRRQVNDAFNLKKNFLNAEKAKYRAEKNLKSKQGELEKLETVLKQAEHQVGIEQEKLTEIQNKLSILQDNKPVDEQDLLHKEKELISLKSVIEEIIKLQKNRSIEVENMENIKKELQEAKSQYKSAKEHCINAENILNNIKKQLEDSEIKLKELEHKNYASRLAETLKPGQPCPVCGSVVHPSPAVLIENTKIKEMETHLKLLKEKYEEAEKNYNAAREKSTKSEISLVAKLQMFENAKNAVEKINREIYEARQRLPENYIGKDTDELKRLLKEENQKTEKMQKDLTEWQNKVKEVTQEVEELKSVLAEAREKMKTAEAQKAAAHKAVEEANENLKTTEMELDRIKQDLDKARGQIPIDRIEKEKQSIDDADKKIDDLNKQIRKTNEDIKLLEKKLQNLDKEKNQAEVQRARIENNIEQLNKQFEEKKSSIQKITQGRPAEELLENTVKALEILRKRFETSKSKYDKILELKNKVLQDKVAAQKALSIAVDRNNKARETLDKALRQRHFTSKGEAEECLCSETEINEMKNEVDTYRKKEESLKNSLKELENKLNGRNVTQKEWEKIQEDYKNLRKSLDQVLSKKGEAKRDYEDIKKKHLSWLDLEKQRKELAALENKLKELQSVLRGNAFVEFIAEEQLMNVALEASKRLGQLTKHRYALEIGSDGAFIMRDDANGGVKRPVSTLSGGETFLTSLALALALSSQIQLKGECPLEFFFLDEGFGSLDSELLEIVMDTLEKLHFENLTIGIISHVPELRNRLARRLIVEPAEPGGRGSRVSIEIA
ncbi:MAG: repair protein SbcC/Rad50 [Thermosediminibacterales bacterium]|nr:repair protein SbcC/Rad50 [Thermosediminibacterales bacterium]MDK2835285.1 repair protein SbcC/Rad50 [Thermosediminibacterales bacterium]